MRKGITTALLAGLCFGLILIGGNLDVAEASYGAYEDFIGQISSTLRALAELGQLSQWVHRQNGVILETVTSDGTWTVYASGIQHRGYVYDTGQEEWYEQTIYYSKGAILQYAVTLKLVENEDGSFSQVGVSRIIAYDSLGQAEFGIEVEGDVHISALDPAQLEALVGLVTDGTSEEEVDIGDAEATLKLTSVFISGADIIELGYDGVFAYMDELGVDMGCMALSGGTSNGLVVRIDEDTGEEIVVAIEDVTPDDLAESQRLAAELMLKASVESGVSAGDNALDVAVGEGLNEVDSSILADLIYQGDLEAFKNYMQTSPYADEVDFSGWSDDDWQDLLNKVVTLVDDDPDNDVPYDEIFTIGGYEIKFIQETTSKGDGFRVEIKGADAQWRPVRHVTFSEVAKGQHTEVENEPYVSGHIVTGYTILTGDAAGTSVNLDDPTVFGTRTEEVDVSIPMWGDPTALGTVNYDAATDTLTMTVTRWKDEEGNWHDETLAVTLDFSRIAEEAQREAVRQEFIAGSLSGSIVVCFGEGDTLEEGQIFYILGLGEH